MPKPAPHAVRAEHHPRHRGASNSESKPAPSSRPPRPAVQAIREDQDEIVEALLAKAKHGSYLHAKFLFDFAGLTCSSDEERAAREPSLAELLLEKLALEPLDPPL